MRRIIVTEGACSGCNIMKEFKPRVVAVIPCYNTSSHIAEVVTKDRKDVEQSMYKEGVV